jgi:hypothetical protein
LSLSNSGTFSRWGPREVKGDERRYKAMMYENGGYCEANLYRSTEVDLECGNENKIVYVSEPEKCQYYFKMQTPAVCEDVKDDEESDEIVREEL